MILKTVSDFPGITAKNIGKKVHLSPYLSLVCALKLVKLNLLTYTLAMSDEEPKLVYLFYPVLRTDVESLSVHIGK